MKRVPYHTWQLNYSKDFLLLMIFKPASIRLLIMIDGR